MPQFLILRLFPLLLFLVACAAAGDRAMQQTKAPSLSLHPVSTGFNGSCRGLDVVDAQTIWISGQYGTWIRSTDGGANWQSGTIPGADSLDFRDVEAFGADTAYLLAAGEGEKSRLYKTLDGGETWRLQFLNNAPEGFYSAMAFWDEQRGIAFSDPLNGRFRILRTSDGGANWNILPEASSPVALEGEYAFAASGTCIITQGKQRVWIATGGKHARVWRSADGGDSWQAAETPFVAGTASTGIFSLAFRDSLHGIATGGDYQNPDSTANNVAITTDGGESWQLTDSGRQLAYRSCVRYLPGHAGWLVAVGRNGCSYSSDDGQSWQILDSAGYFVLGIAPDGSVGWAAGSEGRVARLAIQQ